MHVQYSNDAAIVSKRASNMVTRIPYAIVHTCCFEHEGTAAVAAVGTVSKTVTRNEYCYCKMLAHCHSECVMFSAAQSSYIIYVDQCISFNMLHSVHCTSAREASRSKHMPKAFTLHFIYLMFM
jgi:hypothetical protein